MELTRGRYYDDVQDADNDKDDDGDNHSEHDDDDETFSEYAIHIAWLFLKWYVIYTAWLFLTYRFEVTALNAWDHVQARM